MWIRARTVVVASLAIAALIGGCGGVSGASAPTAPARLIDVLATPTALAAELGASNDMSASDPPTAAIPGVTPRPKTTTKLTAFYKPPGWDGSSDVDCPDFDTHAHAQSFFRGTHGSTTYDPYRLDRDHDGIACETLP